MTQEEKQLLIKDICARLPYGLKVKIGEFSDYMLIGIDTTSDKQPLIIKHADDIFTCGIGIVKPYLRPMSSMAKEEFDEYMQFIKHSWEGIDKEEDDYYIKVKDRDVYTDWLLEHHLDYRGLIPIGLALEAPKDMYKTE